jgi:hypothetical protein
MEKNKQKANINSAMIVIKLIERLICISNKKYYIDIYFYKLC